MMDPDTAAETVAAHALHHWAVYGFEWDMYPEIGEHDWQHVLEYARALTPAPDPEQFKQAYAFLEARAEPDA